MENQLFIQEVVALSQERLRQRPHLRYMILPRSFYIGYLLVQFGLQMILHAKVQVVLVSPDELASGVTPIEGLKQVIAIEHQAIVDVVPLPFHFQAGLLTHI